MVVLSAKQLKRICVASFKGAGCSDYEAECISDLLVQANLEGHDSHGAGVYLPLYVSRILTGRIKPGAKIEIVKENPVMARAQPPFSPARARARVEGCRICIHKLFPHLAIWRSSAPRGICQSNRDIMC